MCLNADFGALPLYFNFFLDFSSHFLDAVAMWCFWHLTFLCSSVWGLSSGEKLYRNSTRWNFLFSWWIAFLFPLHLFTLSSSNGCFFILSRIYNCAAERSAQCKIYLYHWKQTFLTVFIIGIYSVTALICSSINSTLLANLKIWRPARNQKKTDANPSINNLRIKSHKLD